MSVLVYIVSHPMDMPGQDDQHKTFGSRALKPAIAVYPQFLEMLVSRLSSADHALCANALQLINALMRESITYQPESEWSNFIKRLQDLGVIRNAYALMQSDALQDLAHPLLEFQTLTKVLLKKWREVGIDQKRQDHRRALKGLQFASNADKLSDHLEDVDESGKKTQIPEKWRRLGFETENPASEFGEVGFLGMMDLTEYVRRNEDGFQKFILEQSAQISEHRCPVARASLAVTAVLYEHFEIEKCDADDAKSNLVLESKSNYEKVFMPLILQWSKLHAAGVQAFFRLWKATGAELEDFYKIVDLVRILVEAVVGAAARTKGVIEVVEEMKAYQYERLRQLQMELLELSYEDTRGQHLRQIRDELNHEALQFIKEQRIRCLLRGAWFPNHSDELESSLKPSVRFAKLSHNRRYLHYADFTMQLDVEPELEDLPEKIDLGHVSSVRSDMFVPPAKSSTTTLKNVPQDSSSKITIHGYKPLSAYGHSRKDSSRSDSTPKEIVLLVLHPQSRSLASEWVDGLMMLLNQEPITAQTKQLTELISSYGLKIRLLNVRYDDPAFASEMPEIPSREGLDEDYYYDMGT